MFRFLGCMVVVVSALAGPGTSSPAKAAGPRHADDRCAAAVGQTVVVDAGDRARIDPPVSIALDPVPEARERVLALQTTDGTLVPILEDTRGRAFRRDERLREMTVELDVRRYRTSPAVQLIRVLEVAKDGRYEIDYWCDICAIATVETKDCECCQGPVELRRRKVDR